MMHNRTADWVMTSSAAGVTSMQTVFFFSSRRRHTRCSRDWSSDVCSSDLVAGSSQLVFPPPDAVPNSAAFSVWVVASGAIVRTVSGPQPNDDYPLNRALHLDRKSVV